MLKKMDKRMILFVAIHKSSNEDGLMPGIILSSAAGRSFYCFWSGIESGSVEKRIGPQEILLASFIADMADENAACCNYHLECHQFMYR